MTITDDKRAAVRAALKRERARVIRVLATYRRLYQALADKGGDGRVIDLSRVFLCEELIETLGGPEAVARVKRRASTDAAARTPSSALTEKSYARTVDQPSVATAPTSGGGSTTVTPGAAPGSSNTRSRSRRLSPAESHAYER